MSLWNIPSRVATAGLVGLAVADVFLVGTALRSTRTSEIDARPLSSTSAPVSSAGASRSLSPAASSGQATVAAIDGQVAPLRTLLVALDNEHAWRANVGSCSAGGATLASTTDGGTTWSEEATPLRKIVRVQSAGGPQAFVIGADSGCTPKLRETSDGGSTWSVAGAVGGAWFRDPQNATSVGAPGLTTSRPCGRQSVLDLAILSTESARVLCADGQVRTSVDTGSSWKVSGKVVGAVAIAVRSGDPTKTYVARLHPSDCAGVQILRVGQAVAQSCIGSALPQKPGQIALSLVDGGGWMTLGATTMRSTDDLVTWKVS